MPPKLTKFRAAMPEAHQLNVTEWGDADKAPLVCVHGLTRNSRDFDFLAQALEAHYNIICPDMAGRGASDWLKNPVNYNYGTYVTDCMALLAARQFESVDWVGTSMGGIIGMMLAASKPGLIKKLVINDIGAFVPAEGLNRIAVYARNQARIKTMPEAQDWIRKIFAPFGITDDAQWQHMYDNSLMQNADGTYSLCYDPEIGNVFKDENGNFKPSEDISLWPIWEAIECPVLIIRGADSNILLHETVQEMVARKKGGKAEFIEFKDFGHAPPLFNAEQIGVVKDYLLKP